MAARVVAKGRCCSRCRPSRLLVSQSHWGGVGRSAAMGWCRNGQTEKSEQAAAALELPKGSGGSSQLPCKHRPSTQSTNLIMGGVPPPPQLTQTHPALLQLLLFLLISPLTIIDCPNQTRMIRMSAPGSCTERWRAEQFMDMEQ